MNSIYFLEMSEKHKQDWTTERPHTLDKDHGAEKISTI